MPSPFPGMNPYLEHHALWPEVHKRLIVAIADALSPQLRPQYRVAIEERIYQTIGEDNTLLVGIPDVAVQHQRSKANPTRANVTVASPPVKPMTVTIPMPETVREGYLEVRDVATREVVDRASYDLVLDYSREPVPPLKESDAAWSDTLLREKSLR